MSNFRPTIKAESRLHRVVGFVHRAWTLNHPTFRSPYIVGAIIVVTLPLVIASIVVPLSLGEALKRSATEHLHQVATDLAAMTEIEMVGHVETIRAFAKVQSLETTLAKFDAGQLSPEERAATDKQLSLLLNEMDVQCQALFLSDPTGRVFSGVLSKKGNIADLGINISDRPYFAEAKRTQRAVISDPVESKLDGAKVIVIAAPIIGASGEISGLLGVVIDVANVTDPISRQKIRTTGYPVAIDRSGMMVAHPNPDRKFKYLTAVPGAKVLAQRMLRGESGVEQYVASTGQAKLAAFVPVPSLGWSIAATMDTAEFDAPARRVRNSIYFIIGAAVFGAGFAGLIFAVAVEEMKVRLAQAVESERRFKLFASVANVAVWDWDVKANELWWNDELAKRFGHNLNATETLETGFHAHIPPDYLRYVSTGINHCIDQGSWAGEHPFKRANGSIAYVLHRAVAVRSNDGSTARVVGSLTDITDRRESEKRLLEQAALLNQAREGISVRNLDHTVRFWNMGAEKMFGWSNSDAVGKNVAELLKIDPAAFSEAYSHVLKKDEWSGSFTTTTANGIQVIIESQWTLLRDTSGHPEAVFTIDTDVTEKNAMEAKFLRAQRLESIGTLAGGIAHDLNNLLSPIIMGVDLLEGEKLTPEQGGILACIKKSAQRGTGLVKQVLSFARGVEGSRVAVHVGFVAREIQSITQTTFPKNIQVQLQVAKDTWLVKADPTQINQVLMNLCVNARDAMPMGGQITIAASNVEIDDHFTKLNASLTPGRYVVVEVADTGTGMSEETLQKIFEPFFTTKELGKGTGLGLSTVIGIAKSHGGTVNVYSEIGKGSVFKVYLPAMAGIEEAAAEGDVEVAPAGNGELVLLVDDEPSILAVTKTALEAYGYKVMTALDGAEAFATFHVDRKNIDLVLTDMMMPVMDGYALITALRRVNPSLPIIAASGMNDNNNQLKASAAGIEHFLCKPYSSMALLKMVKQALTRQAVSRLPADSATSSSA